MKSDTSYYDTTDEHNGLLIEFKPYEIIKELDVDIRMDDYKTTSSMLSSPPFFDSQDDV